MQGPGRVMTKMNSTLWMQISSSHSRLLSWPWATLSGILQRAAHLPLLACRPTLGGGRTPLPQQSTAGQGVLEESTPRQVSLIVGECINQGLMGSFCWAAAVLNWILNCLHFLHTDHTKHICVLDTPEISPQIRLRPWASQSQGKAA